MRRTIIKLFATGFGIGRTPVAPGLAGSLVGLGWWWLLLRATDWWAYWGLLLLGVIFAVWCAGEAALILRHEDPPSVVIDEIVAVPLALLWLPMIGWQIGLAFVLFRVFDVWKPFPIRQSQDLSGGLGIVVDDILAALAACGVTHAVVWAISRFS